MPAFVAATSCTTGATTCTTGTNPTNGDSLITFVASNSTGATITVADGEGTGNTYTLDGSVQGGSIQGKVYHAFAVTGSGAYTITVTGATTPAIEIIEVSGITAKETLASGTNPSTTNGGVSPATPASMTTNDANVILLDFYGDIGGGTTTIAQVDGTFTSRGTDCTNGGSCFIAAIGTKVVTSTGTFSDGWTISSPSSNIAMLAAYK